MVLITTFAGIGDSDSNRVAITSNVVVATNVFHHDRAAAESRIWRLAVHPEITKGPDDSGVGILLAA